MKLRKFRLHFNRINMQRRKPTVWTIHMSDCCIPAVEVDCRVPTKTVFRPDGPQPRAWFEGRGYVVATGRNTYKIIGKLDAT